MLPHELVLQLRDLFFLQNTIHWIKAITIDDENGATISRGHFKPVNSRRFLNDCHEYIFHLTPAGRTPIDRLALGVPYADKSNIARWRHTRGRDRRCRGNTWFIPYKTISRRDKHRPHPATFPVELAENCIRLHGMKKKSHHARSISRHRKFRNRRATLRREKFIGFEIDEELSRRSETADRVAQTSPCCAVSRGDYQFRTRHRHGARDARPKQAPDSFCLRFVPGKFLQRLDQICR